MKQIDEKMEREHRKLSEFFCAVFAIALLSLLVGAYTPLGRVPYLLEISTATMIVMAFATIFHEQIATLNVFRFLRESEDVEEAGSFSNPETSRKAGLISFSEVMKYEITCWSFGACGSISLGNWIGRTE